LGDRYENSEQFTTIKKNYDANPFQTLPFAIGSNSIDEEYGRNTQAFIGLTD
jgi:hypothetical protein